jgi:putative lipoprotein
MGKHGTMRLRCARRAAVWLLLARGLQAVQAAGLSGSAYHGEMLAWPRETLFEARLLDVTAGDALPKVLGSVRIAPPPPGIVSFEIEYDPARIRPGRRYAVDASVSVAGQPWFVTEPRPRVFDKTDVGPHPPLNLRMVRVAPPPSARPEAASVPGP